MVGKRKKVFVALSGGVDSSTAAALLCQNGFDCAGVIRKVAHIAVMWYKDKRTEDRGPFDKLRVNSRQRTK